MKETPSYRPRLPAPPVPLHASSAGTGLAALTGTGAGPCSAPCQLNAPRRQAKPDLAGERECAWIQPKLRHELPDPCNGAGSCAGAPPMLLTLVVALSASPGLMRHEAHGAASDSGAPDVSLVPHFSRAMCREALPHSQLLKPQMSPAGEVPSCCQLPAIALQLEWVFPAVSAVARGSEFLRLGIFFPAL